MDSLTATRPAPVRPPAVAFRLASDARLARLAAAGSEGAMAAIFERHHQALHRYCYSIVGNGHDAADALQNTLVKALRSLPGETREIALRPWLYRIAHNESVSLLRSRRQDSDLDAAAHVGDTAAASLVESRERLRALAEDLAELTERQRGALLMRELGGLEVAEIAAALGGSVAGVKQSVYEARCALQAMEEGRAMDCDAVRRTLSDGDRRMLRGLRMRGHLRACAGCSTFERALHHRPAQLAAIVPPLPAAAAAAMLHGVLGGGGGGGGASGLGMGVLTSAKATAGLSLGVKAAGVAAVTATLAGGAVYGVPALEATPRHDAPAARTQAAPKPARATTAGSRVQASLGRLEGSAEAGEGTSLAGSALDRGLPAATSEDGAEGATAKPAGRAGGDPGGPARGRPARAQGAKPVDAPRGKPATTAARRPAGAPAREPARGPGIAAANRPAGGSGTKPIAVPKPVPAGGQAPAVRPDAPAGAPAPAAATNATSAITAAGTTRPPGADRPASTPEPAAP